VVINCNPMPIEAKFNYFKSTARGDEWGASISLGDLLQRIGRGALAGGIGVAVLEIISAFKGAAEHVNVDLHDDHHGWSRK